MKKLLLAVGLIALLGCSNPELKQPVENSAKLQRKYTYSKESKVIAQTNEFIVVVCRNYGESYQQPLKCWYIDFNKATVEKADSLNKLADAYIEKVEKLEGVK